MKNQEVAEAFAEGKTEGKGSNLFIEKWQNSTIIYSYGKHFPIAIRTSEIFAFLNSDKYSKTTSKHQTYVKQALKDNHFEIEEKTTKELKEIIKNGGVL